MRAVITDHEFPHVEIERQIFESAGIGLEVCQCRSAGDVISHARKAEALLVNRAPINREVLSQLESCKVIVRYGIGCDNIDLAAAMAHRIAVCNVPDYATGEVADHALALTLALGRHLPLVDRRLRNGIWKGIPGNPMPSFRQMRFVTLGYGRIARDVITRARVFGFELGSHDPFIDPETMRKEAVIPLALEEALATADILSLHLPLTSKTRHLINADSLRLMKKTAILVNTSRGMLVDTPALIEALQQERLFAAGLDVFESEPLPGDHPIFECPRALLTSHLAWYSEASIVRLQRMAAEEATRGLLSLPLKNQVKRH